MRPQAVPMGSRPHRRFLRLSEDNLSTEAQRSRQQPLAVVEAVRQHVIERGVEDQPIAAELPTLFRNRVEQSSADPAAPLGFDGYEVIDVDEPAVDQVFFDAITCQTDRDIAAPGCEDTIAG